MQLNNLSLLFLILFTLIAPTLADVDEARKAADEHYALVVAGDEAAWAKTFNKSDYELYERAVANGIRGHVLEGRWRSAKRRADAGTIWVHQRTDKAGDSEVKFFYIRKKDGSQDGYPVPIRMVLEDGRWVVASVTY